MEESDPVDVALDDSEEFGAAAAKVSVEIATIDSSSVATIFLIVTSAYRLSPLETVAPDIPEAPLTACSGESTIASE